MAKTYEQLKASHVVLNELLEDLQNKLTVKDQVEASYQELDFQLTQLRSERKSTFEKKMLGKAKIADVEKLDSKIQALEKKMEITAEELEIVKTYTNVPLYDEHAIYQGHREFLDEFYKTELPLFEQELKAAKDAYLEKLNNYMAARNLASKVGSDVYNYMLRFGMKNAYYNLPRIAPPKKDLLVNPKHLEDKGIRY